METLEWLSAMTVCNTNSKVFVLFRKCRYNVDEFKFSQEYMLNIMTYTIQAWLFCCSKYDYTVITL